MPRSIFKRPWITVKELLQQGIPPFHVVGFFQDGGAIHCARTGKKLDVNADREQFESLVFGKEHEVKTAHRGKFFADTIKVSNDIVIPAVPERPDLLCCKTKEIFPFIASIMKKDGFTHDEIFAALFPEEYENGSVKDDAIRKRVQRLLGDKS